MGKNEVVLTFAGDAKPLKKVFGDVGGGSDQLQNKVGANSDKIKNGFNVASTAIIAGGVGIAVGLAKIGGDFDDAYDRIRAGTGATGAAFAGLQSDLKAVASEVPADLGSIGDAIADVNKRTGETGKGLQDLTSNFLQLGKVSGEDVPALIAAGTRVFGDWNIATGDQVKTLDKLLRASQATGIGVTNLADLVVSFGAPLRQLGFSFDESIALLGKWEKEGVNTELVLGGLKKALGTFAKAGDDPIQALGKFTAAIKNAGSTAEANKIAVETLGVKAGPDFAAAVREGRLEYEALVKQIAGGTETIKSTADGTADFAEKLQLLKNRGFIALEPVSAAVFEKLNEGADILEKVGHWASENQGTVKDLAVALGGLAVAVVAINVGLKVYQAAVAVATAVQWLWNIALTANPIGLVIFAIAALVGGIYLLWTNSAGFRDFFIGMWDGIWSFLKAIGSWFAGPFAGFFVDTWNTIKATGQVVWDWLTHIPDKLAAAFVRIAPALSAPFRAAFNFISDAWNNTIGALHWTVPNWIPGLGGKSISVPNLPKFHTGGTVPGSPGSEMLAVLQAGETVTPAGQSGGFTVIELRSSGTAVDDLLVQILQRAVKARGGNVQIAIGK